MSAHTPGPWGMCNGEGSWARVTEAMVDGDIIADKCTWANARLIAAAPEGHALAQLVVDAEQAPMASGKTGYTRPTEKQWRAIVDAARAAIAKVERWS